MVHAQKPSAFGLNPGVQAQVLHSTSITAPNGYNSPFSVQPKSVGSIHSPLIQPNSQSISSQGSRHGPSIKSTPSHAASHSFPYVIPSSPQTGSQSAKHMHTSYSQVPSSIVACGL